MKILLIHPQCKEHRLETGIYGRHLRYAPITMPMLATLVPPELKADVRVVDELVERVPLDARPELVGITCIAGTAARAYELADHFRAHGVTVILGGVHVSLHPGEAAPHADSVVVGYAEEAWPQLLRDYQAGVLSPRYSAGSSPLRYVAPDRRTIRRRRYAQPNTVELFRGCVNRCEFCVSRTLYRDVISRPVDEVIAEIRSLPGKMISFLDPNLMADRAVARAFFERLAPLRKWWVGCATVEAAEDAELLDLMARSGCKGLLVGFESINQAAIDAIGKTFNRVDAYAAAVRMFHARGILVEGCFVFGFDQDDADVFGRTVEFVTRAHIDYVHYTIYTPFPGTDAYRRLDGEKRILTRDWSRYTGRQVVFQPHGMTPGRLTEGYHEAWSETYRPRNMLRRLSCRPWLLKPIILAANIAIARFQRRATVVVGA